MKPKKKYADEIYERTLYGMKGAGFSWNDIPAIRTVANDAVDGMVREGEISEKQANRWSQDKLVKKVSRQMKKEKLRRIA